MKTLLFLLDRYPAFGGIETVTTVLANNLAEHYRIIICSQRGEPEHELLRRLHSGIIFRRIPHDKKKEAITALDSLLSEEQVDIVIYQDSYAPNEYLAHHIAQRGNAALIVAEHSAPGHSKRWTQSLAALPWWDIYHRLKMSFFGGKTHLRLFSRRSRLYRICDSYVVLSEQLKREFSENSFIRDTSKLHAIGNPVSYSPVSDFPKKKQKQLLFIGQFVPLKGIDRLLRIWERVQDKAPDWSLVLVGDGPQMDSVRDHIRTHHLKRVELPGFRTDVRDYCERASIFCLCSDFEGFPMVLPEAMSSGAVPVAFQSFASLQDIMADGLEGYSVPAFDEEAYAACLLKLMENESLLSCMSDAALRKSRVFNIQSITAQWIALIEGTH